LLQNEELDSDDVAGGLADNGVSKSAVVACARKSDNFSPIRKFFSVFFGFSS
jgi:hypothetical protein